MVYKMQKEKNGVVLSWGVYTFEEAALAVADIHATYLQEGEEMVVYAWKEDEESEVIRRIPHSYNTEGREVTHDLRATGSRHSG